MTDSPKLKAQLRQWAKQQRQTLKQRELLSDAICRRLADLPAYRNARTVLWYLGVGDEVSTRAWVDRELAAGQKTIAVPFCTHDRQGDRCLGLWRLTALSELVESRLGLLEPPESRWLEADRLVLPEQLDAVLVPGLAFDAQGGRLGYGAGFYDRLLCRLRPDAAATGLGFEAQRLDRVIMEPHDVALDWLVTETSLYRGRGRA